MHRLCKRCTWRCTEAKHQHGASLCSTLHLTRRTAKTTSGEATCCLWGAKAMRLSHLYLGIPGRVMRRTPLAKGNCEQHAPPSQSRLSSLALSGCDLVKVQHPQGGDCMNHHQAIVRLLAAGVALQVSGRLSVRRKANTCCRLAGTSCSPSRAACTPSQDTLF